jgi:hypothetical protein
MIAAAASAALALTACATATPYQPLQRGSAVSGGFSEQQVESNRWRIAFTGNSLTSRETVERYLLYRAAELTLTQGYDWFEMVDRQTNRDTRYYPDPFYDSWGGWGGWWGPSWRVYHRGYWGGWSPWGRWGYWGGRPWGGSSFDYDAVTRYEANAEIFMGRGPKPAESRRAFDARDVERRLGPSIVRPR